MTTVMDHTPAADADVWSLIEAEEPKVTRVVVVHTWPFCSHCIDWHTLSEMREIGRRYRATSGALVRGEGL